MLSLSAQAFPLIQPWESAGIYFIYLFIFPLWQFLLACSLPKGQLMLGGIHQIRKGHLPLVLLVELIDPLRENEGMIHLLPKHTPKASLITPLKCPFLSAGINGM